jgi:hypothetical protein
VLKFKPTSTGAKTATLSVPSNDPLAPIVTVALSGTGTTPVPEIFVSPLSVPFGTVPVGGTSGPGFQVTVRNDGSANLVLGAFTITGTNADQFKAPPAGDGCSGRTLAPAASCTTVLKFKPTEGGAKTATLVIPSNDSDENPVNVALSGTGGGPEITVTPASIPFGTVPVGGSSGPQFITVRNDGTENLTLGALTLVGPNPGEFKIPIINDFCSNQTLAPAASCTAIVKFKPTTVGPASATVSIPSNDASEPTATVPLTGTGQ